MSEYDARRVRVGGGECRDAASIRSPLEAASVAPLRRHQRGDPGRRMSTRENRFELSRRFGLDRIERDADRPAPSARRTSSLRDAHDVAREALERAAAQLERKLELEPVADRERNLRSKPRAASRQVDQLREVDLLAVPEGRSRSRSEVAGLCAVPAGRGAAFRSGVPATPDPRRCAPGSEPRARAAARATRRNPDRECRARAGPLTHPAGATNSGIASARRPLVTRRSRACGTSRAPSGPPAEREIAAEALQDHAHAIQLAVIEQYDRGKAGHDRGFGPSAASLDEPGAASPGRPARCGAPRRRATLRPRSSL